MAVAEAGGAAELIFGVDEEVACLAPVTPLSLHVLLAVAVASGVVAAGAVFQASLCQAATRLATKSTEVPVVDLALGSI